MTDVQFFSKTSYYDYQDSLILPAVEEAYNKSLDEAQSLVKLSGM